MSVKFEKETVKLTEAITGDGKSDLARTVGEALTKGAGPNGYLAVSGAPSLYNYRHYHAAASEQN